MPNYRLFKRPESDNWYVQLGSQTPKSTKTNDYDKAEEVAEAWANEAFRIKQLGDRAAVPFKTAAEKYLKRRGLRLLPFRPTESERKKIRAENRAAGQKSVNPDEYNMPWILHHLADVPLRDIYNDPEVLYTLQDLGLAEGMVEGEGWSHSTVDRMMNTVSAVLGHAVELRWLGQKPPVPKFNKRRPEPVWWTEDQYRRLVESFNDIRQELTSRFALNSILRMGSMLGMKKSRIDLEARTAWVPGVESKNGDPIPYNLSWELVYLTRELMKLNPRGDWLFQYEGNPIQDCNTWAFIKARKRADVPGNWHTHRHTGAAWFLKSGGTLQELQLQGGWKSLAAVQIYAHLCPKQRHMVADRFGDLAAQAMRGAQSKTDQQSWAVTDSNRGPRPCKDLALPTELTARTEAVPFLITPEPIAAPRIVLADGIFGDRIPPQSPDRGGHRVQSFERHLHIEGTDAKPEPTPAASQSSPSERGRLNVCGGRDTGNLGKNSANPSASPLASMVEPRLVSARDARKNAGLPPNERQKKASGGR